MTSAIIVAAGSSSRMGVDKLFLPVAGRPLVAHTWERFDRAPEIGEIVLVVRDEKRAAFEKLALEMSPSKPWRVAAGGKERQDSVGNGLAALSADSEVVAIQDGARPCTSLEIIRDVVAAARRCGAAVAAQKVTDTLKESADGRTIARNVDRSRLWAVQTPQAFQVGVITRALAAVREQGLSITDDTAACELIGQSVELVESATPNPKATTRADLAFIEMLLLRSSSNEAL